MTGALTAQRGTVPTPAAVVGWPTAVGPRVTDREMGGGVNTVRLKTERNDTRSRGRLYSLPEHRTALSPPHLPKGAHLDARRSITIANSA